MFGINPWKAIRPLYQIWSRLNRFLFFFLKFAVFSQVVGGARWALDPFVVQFNSNELMLTQLSLRIYYSLSCEMLWVSMKWLLQRANGSSSKIPFTFFPLGKGSWLVIDSTDILRPIEQCWQQNEPYIRVKNCTTHPAAMGVFVFQVRLHEDKRALLPIGCIINVFNVLQMNLLWPKPSGVLFLSGCCEWRPKLFILLAALLTFENLQLANKLILALASDQQVSDSQWLLPEP